MSTRAHLLLAAMVAATLVVIVRMVRRGQLRAKYSMLWLSVGAALVVLLAIPGSLDSISLRLGIYYPPALFFMGAIALLFFVVVHLSYELSRLENRSRTLGEEVALLNERLRTLEDEREGLTWPR